MVAGVFCALPGADTAIGMAIANGTFRIDHSQVWGSTTLLDGSKVESVAAAPELQLYAGANLRLAAESRITVYAHKSVLESG